MAQARKAQEEEQGTALAVDTPETQAAAAAGRETVTTFEAQDAAGYFGSPVDPNPNERYVLTGEAERRRIAAEGRSPDAPDPTPASK